MIGGTGGAADRNVLSGNAHNGLAIAKDVWLLGIGVGLLTRGTVDRQPQQVRRAARTLDKANKKAAKAARRAKG